MLMFCNAENVYLLLSGENFPEIRSEFKYIAKCLKGAQNRSPNGTCMYYVIKEQSLTHEKLKNIKASQTYYFCRPAAAGRRIAAGTHDFSSSKV